MVDNGSTQELNSLIQQISACTLVHTIGLEEAQGEDSDADENAVGT